MESAKNAKRRRRASTADEESEALRNAYYKKLRRAQKKRRMERKKKRVVQQQAMKETPVVKPNEAEKNDLLKKPDDNSLSSATVKKAEPQSTKYLPRGKQMVSASLKTAVQPASKKKITAQTATTSKPEPSTSKSVAGIMEIDPANVKRETGSKPIGSGTFGTCFLATYRGIKVVVKEYKEKVQGGSTSKLQREAINEAQIISQLGDHPGIPFLIGVMLKKLVSLWLKFHGDGEESLTVYKAAKEGKIKEESQWKEILWHIADALQHIHHCSFIHNDLKSNNVVLETKDGRKKPVIIDFGKSVKEEKATKPKAKPLNARDGYKDSYIAPELIDGTGKPCANTDVFALCHLIKKVYKLLKFDLPPVVALALTQPPERRPSIAQLKLSALTGN